MSSVRVRVTLAATAAALVAVLIAAAVFLLSLRHAMEEQLVTSAQQQISDVQIQLRGGEPPQEAVLTGKGDVVIQLLDAEGLVVATDHPQVLEVLRDRAGIDKDVDPEGLDGRYVVVAEPVDPGSGLVVVGRSTEQVERATEVSAVLLAIGLPIGLGLVALAAWIAVGRALRPVESMRREAATITDTRLDRRLAVPEGGDEIPRLASTLNEMLDRIGASSRLQEQFVSDASHELRSPLTTLRQLAEVARDYPDRTSQESFVRDVLAEEQRMEELVAALLVLARTDEAAHGPAEPVDLDDLVLEAVRRQRAVATASIDVSAVSAGQVVGDRVLLGQVVTNLLANACRHAASRVVVALGERDGAVVLTVDDDGEGIPGADRERVFERFVRLDEARARDEGGSGLGLAIVRTVVTSLGGSVHVEDAPLGGARFVVRLPTA